MADNMKKTMTLIAWGLMISIIFISIFYMISHGISGYFVYSEDGSILRDTKICSPVWVSNGLYSVDSVCLESCETIHKVSNYKIEDLNCFCDLNNCKIQQ